MIQPFQFATIPKIIFGPGTIKELFDVIPEYGKNLLFITGSSSLKNSGKWDFIKKSCLENNINYFKIQINNEPSPQFIDEAVKNFQGYKLDLIVGIGGGSVIDAGKAISAMLNKKDSVKHYLEGVGDKIHDGQKLPYIAVPTTSGTGSEATKNAVISEISPNGFKKSLRHNNFIPNIAIIDPELTISCPKSITASCGMDAFTQLLEAYVSTNSNSITDVLALSGIQQVKDALIPASLEMATNINIRSSMAYGSLLSGIVLANAGLGIIHGFASSIGGKFDIPHGIVCGTLLAEATKTNIKKLKDLGNFSLNSLKRYAKIGALLSNVTYSDEKVVEHTNDLIEVLNQWTEILKIDPLSKFGITKSDIGKLVEETSQKNNPVSLNKEDMKNILINRL